METRIGWRGKGCQMGVSLVGEEPGVGWGVIHGNEIWYHIYDKSFLEIFSEHCGLVDSILRLKTVKQPNLPAILEFHLDIPWQLCNHHFKRNYPTETAHWNQVRCQFAAPKLFHQFLIKSWNWREHSLSLNLEGFSLVSFDNVCYGERLITL
ncbi:hypothetical protein CEXT_218251 [Caerostris extrusa]|uniref:Maturase K n=1 Tax=Caerostris extrusa TaxID=172846 RepID=A0AAV4TX81_CAEEX|nr:hypothetical protein CEXT_218251 [Caerostris extrusa]